MRLKPGRYEYAFIVDGKHWVADRFARTTRDNFDTESAVFASSPTATTTTIDGSLARIKKALPRPNADRVLEAIAGAKSSGLPAVALENRTLKFVAKRVPPKDIERAIIVEASRMRKAHDLLFAADRQEPSDGEIIAAAELLGRDSDTTGITALIRSVPSNRTLEVPFRVSDQLIAADVPTRDALTRVQDRLHAGASDAQLERLLDEPVTTVASHTKGKATPTHAAKAASGATVRQAGVPSKSRTPPTKRKTPGN